MSATQVPGCGTFLRLDEERVVRWLRAKHARVTELIRTEKLCAGVPVLGPELRLLQDLPDCARK